MNHTDLSARKGHVRMGFLLAVPYQLIVAAHIVLLCFFPQINSSFMISVGCLYGLAWVGYCFLKNIHELAGGPLFGISFLALYLIRNSAYRFVRRFVEISLSEKILISYLITAEAGFLFMLLILLSAMRRLGKEPHGPNRRLNRHESKNRDLLFFFVLFLLLTAACMLGLRYDPYQTVAVGQDAPGFPGITVSISSETFTTKEFLLTYTVTNDTDREFLADTSPRIERQRSDGQWEYRVDRRTGTVSGQRAYLPSGDNVVLFPGKTSSPVEISLKQYWPSLKEGTYRLALDYHSDEGYYTAYAVFTVA